MGGRSRRGGGNNQDKTSAPDSSAAAGGGSGGGAVTTVPKKSQPPDSPLASLLTALGTGAAAVAVPRQTSPSVASPVASAAAPEGATSAVATAAPPSGVTAVSSAQRAAVVPNWKSRTLHTWRKDNITVVNLRDDNELLQFPVPEAATTVAATPSSLSQGGAAAHRAPTGGVHMPHLAAPTAAAAVQSPPPYKESAPADSSATTRNVAALLSASAGGGSKAAAAAGVAPSGGSGGAGAASLQVFLNDQLARMREMEAKKPNAAGSSSPGAAAPSVGQARPSAPSQQASLEIHGGVSGRVGSSTTSSTRAGHDLAPPPFVVTGPSAAVAKGLTSPTINSGGIAGSVPLPSSASASSRGQSPAPAAVTALFSDPLWSAGTSSSKVAEEDESLTVDFLTGILGDLRGESSQANASGPAPVASAEDSRPSLWKELTPPPQQHQQQQQQWTVSPLHQARSAQLTGGMVHATGSHPHHMVGTTSPPGAVPLGAAYVVAAAPNGMSSYVPLTQFVTAAPMQAFGHQQVIALPQGMQLVHQHHHPHPQQHHHHHHSHHHHGIPATSAANAWAVPRGRPGTKVMNSPAAMSAVPTRQAAPIVMNMQQLRQLGATAAAAGQPPPQVKYMTLDEFQRMMGQQGQQAQTTSFTVAAVQPSQQPSPLPTSPKHATAAPPTAGAKPPTSPPSAPAGLPTRTTVQSAQAIPHSSAAAAASGSRSAASANGVNVGAVPFVPKPG